MEVSMKRHKMSQCLYLTHVIHPENPQRFRQHLHWLMIWKKALCVFVCLITFFHWFVILEKLLTLTNLKDFFDPFRLILYLLQPALW